MFGWAKTGTQVSCLLGQDSAFYHSASFPQMGAHIEEARVKTRQGWALTDTDNLIILLNNYKIK